METNLLGKPIWFTHEDTDEGEGTKGSICAVYLKGNDVYFLIAYVNDNTQFIEMKAAECWQDARELRDTTLKSAGV